MYVVCTFVRFPPSLPLRLPFLCRHRFAAAKYDDFLAIVVTFHLPLMEVQRKKSDLDSLYVLSSYRHRAGEMKTESGRCLPSAHSFVGITSAGLLSPSSVARTTIICHRSISLLLGKR
jgi:hypothetical protein